MFIQRVFPPLGRVARHGLPPCWAREEERRTRSLHMSPSTSLSVDSPFLPHAQEHTSQRPPVKGLSDVRITEYNAHPVYSHYAASKDTIWKAKSLTVKSSSASPGGCDIGGREHVEYKRIKTCFWRVDSLGKAAGHAPDSQKETEWDHGRLEQVIVLCRHGVRLPEHSFPNFTFFPLNKKWWGKFGGQLTPVGVEQMRRIGERLGWYYAPTLNPSLGQSVFDAASAFHLAWEKLTDPFEDTFSKSGQGRSSLHEHFRELIRPVKEKVEVISSGYTRAVFTAQSVMLGLFPDVPLGFFDDADPQDKVYASVKESHLAVHLLGMDAAFAMGHNQRNEYSTLKNRFFTNSKKFDEWTRDPECLALVDKAFRMTGHRFFDPKIPIHRRLEALVLLQQQMEIEYALHMPVFANDSGDRFTLQEETLLKELTCGMHHLKFEGQDVRDQLEMGRAAGGGTLHIISNCMYNRVKALNKGYLDPQEPAEHKQLVLLSAHDQTIMAVLSYLRIRDWPYPQLGATLMFELRSLPDGEFIVQIKYNDDPAHRLMSSCRPFAPPISASGPHHTVEYKDLPLGYVSMKQFNKCFNIAEKWFESAQELVRAENGSKDDWCSSRFPLLAMNSQENSPQRSEEEILKDMKEAFDYFDKDGTGAINKAELGAMLRMLGRNMTNAQLEKMIECNDKDGNGKIEFNEFLDVSTQYMLLRVSIFGDSSQLENS